MRGLNAAQALNLSYHRGRSRCAAARSSTRRSTGTEPHDLSKLIATHRQGDGRAERARAAARRTDRQLQHVLRRLRGPVGAAAPDSSPSCRRSLRNITAGFAALEHASGRPSTFAHDIIPGVKHTNATVTAALPWIEQLQAVARTERARRGREGPGEAGAAARASCEGEQIPLYQQTELFNKCLTNVIIPAGNTKLQDGSASSGVEDYKEFWYSLVGLTASARASTATARARSSSSATAARRCARGKRRSSATRLKGKQLLDALAADAAAERARPTRAEEPPYQPQVPCYKQALPEFNGPLSQGPADGSRMMAPTSGHEGGLSVRDQIERYRSAFIAVVTMIVIAGGRRRLHPRPREPAPARAGCRCWATTTTR